jgi:ribosomal protein S18 acetylase RimI-like enzyme
LAARSRSERIVTAGRTDVSEEQAMADEHPLDNPVRSALLGPHAGFARRHGAVLRYPDDVSRFLALDEHAAPAWRDLAELLGPGESALFAGVPSPLPEGWEHTFTLPGVQMVAEQPIGALDPEAVALGPADVEEMLDLVSRTKPGPFFARTIELGAYLGIRIDGKLAAMAGERMHPPGFVEISAVCTDPVARGRGLATRLVRAVAAGIEARGETPFLHAAGTNVNAIRLYEQLGFRTRRQVVFATVAPIGWENPVE